MGIAKSVTHPLCYGSSLGSNPDFPQKYTIGDISKGVVMTNSSPPKNIQNNKK
jgi:hypothetical protein